MYPSLFHLAWGRDRGTGLRRPDYNKKAWMSVQAELDGNSSKHNDLAWAYVCSKLCECLATGIAEERTRDS